MAPIGIGLALVIGGVTVFNLHWVHVYKFPYTYSMITSGLVKQIGRSFLETHEWYSLGYFAFFMLLGFWDMKMRKEKG